MKILSINIRGFKVEGKEGWFRGIISSSRPVVAAIQETRCHGVNESWVESLWGSVDVGYVEKHVVGRFNNVAWVLCGDFNEVRYEHERKKERRASRFNDFIEENGLLEVPLVGKKFIWISDDGVKFSKLDRLLVSDNFAQLWNDLAAYSLDRKLTDHSPILLKNGSTDVGPKPFRVFDAWLEEAGVGDVIEVAWNENDTTHRPDTVFRLKLKRVKDRLKEWSTNTYGRLDTEIKELIDKSSLWEIEAENRILSDNEREGNGWKLEAIGSKKTWINATC
ncbi:uncharacterized protein [Rutidosis leptorrhynchoides]|uniref:uncharacterized protein n=1 Tax=Rutidosis leptorrhynchoides TaxID=125765 RepID=UPI003A98D76D